MKVIIFYLVAVALVHIPCSLAQYTFFEEKMTYADADRSCREMGGLLAYNMKEIEQDFIPTYRKKLNIDLFWVGVDDLKTEGQYKDGFGNKVSEREVCYKLLKVPKMQTTWHCGIFIIHTHPCAAMYDCSDKLSYLCNGVDEEFYGDKYKDK